MKFQNYSKILILIPIKQFNFSILIFHFCLRKKVFDCVFHFYICLSYLMSNPCKLHRATPPVAPVGAANASLKIAKNRENHQNSSFAPYLSIFTRTKKKHCYIMNFAQKKILHITNQHDP